MKISETRGKTIGFAASGGLDSCTITHWLSQQGVDVVCFTADIGQNDEETSDAIENRMRGSGAVDFVKVVLRNEMAEMGLQVVQAQAKYEGDYWNTTGAARQVIMHGLFPAMRSRGINIFSHGATGRGNDQVRFQVIGSMIAPDLEFYAPWRDNEFLTRFRGRREMLEYCEQHSVPTKASREKPYSTDANLLGLTHEGGALESLDTPSRLVTPGMGVDLEEILDPKGIIAKQNSLGGTSPASVTALCQELSMSLQADRQTLQASVERVSSSKTALLQAAHTLHRGH